MELWNKYKTLLDKYEINTSLRKAHLFGQREVESDGIIRESLNYSVEALLSKFGRHRISEEDARKFGRTDKQKANQVEIANRIYGGKWGKENLGNTEKNDGWLYRGSGDLQVTGRANFAKMSKDTGIDFIGYPELIEEEVNSFIAALWFWKTHNLNYYADRDDCLAVSKIINLGNVNSKGTPNHLKERAEATKKYKQIFK